jgi:hypothetical protein
MANLSSFYPQPVVAGTTEGTFAEGDAPRIIDVTHADLLSLMGAQNLKRGFHYRITDFVTEYMSNDQEWISPSNTANVSNNNGTAFTVASIAATPEPLIVYAYSSSEVSKEAYSELYPSDIIHYNPELTYLDGTNTAKGFIIYRKEINRMIECDYDWRNVRFKRWVFDPTQTTTFSGQTSIAVNVLTPSTQYSVGDIVTLGSSAGNAGILLCVKKHTSPSTITQSGYYPTYNNGEWIAFFNRIRGVTHDPVLKRPLYGLASPTTQGYFGSFGQARYLYTFSESNGSLSTTAVSNIKIHGLVPDSFQDRYSERLNNIVFLRAVTTATNSFRNVVFKDSYKMTLYGVSQKTNNTINNCNSFYVDGLFFKNTILNSEDLYFLTDTRSCNFENSSDTIIHGQNNGIICKNTNQCAIGVRFDNSELNNCTQCSFNGSPKKYKIENLLQYSNLRSLYINPTLQDGINGTEKQASDVVISVGTSKIPHFEYRDDYDVFQRKSIYGSTPILYKHADDAVISRLTSSTDPSFKNIFTTQDHITPAYVRNTNCWCYDLAEKMTCISPWNSASGSPSGVTGGGTLITPRHIYMAAHFKIPVGSTIRFITDDNQVVNRTLVESYTHPSYSSPSLNFDVTVGLLDSDVPASIIPAKTLPENFYDYLTQDAAFYVSIPPCGVMYTDQEEKVLVMDYVAGNSDIHDFYPPTNTLKLSAFETLVSGDSGNPAFLIVNDKLVLISAWSAVRGDGSAFGWDYNTPTRQDLTSKAPLLQAMISSVDIAYGVSTGHQLDIADLSSFVKFTTN